MLHTWLKLSANNWSMKQRERKPNNIIYHIIIHYKYFIYNIISSLYIILVSRYIIIWWYQSDKTHETVGRLVRCEKMSASCHDGHQTESRLVTWVGTNCQTDTSSSPRHLTINLTFPHWLPGCLTKPEPDTETVWPAAVGDAGPGGDSRVLCRAGAGVSSSSAGLSNSPVAATWRLAVWPADILCTEQ